MNREQDTTEIRGVFLIEERPKAMLIEKDGQRHWIPRSQIKYLRKFAPTQAGQEMNITIPEWLANEKNLS